MEYSKEDLMEAKKQILGVGENMGTEESKKIWEENAQFWDNAMGDESYSGDLIYKGSLDAFYPTTDPHLFYQSIRRIRKYNIKKVLPGHHQLDIPVSLIADIEAGFAQLERAGKLKQGNGLFKFQDFQIHI